MKIQAFIARKMLNNSGQVSLLRTLTWISVGGISLGVALLIIVLSVFNGFFNVIEDLLAGWDPDVRIERFDRRPFQSDSLVNSFQDWPELAMISPFVEGKALLANPKKRDKVVLVRGVEMERFFQLQAVKDNLEDGNLDLSVRKGRVGLLMGQRLAYDLAIHVDDAVGLTSASGMQKQLTQFALPRSVPFEVRGIFNMEEVFEGSSVFVDLRTAQRLFDTRTAVHGLDIQLSNRKDADRIKAQLMEQLPAGLVAKTWYDLQKPVYDVMRLEKKAAFIFLMLIVAVAVLNIVGSLSMIVIRKRMDIGVLRTLGLSRADIRAIFLRQGLRIGLIGSGLGTILGLFGAWLQKSYKVVKLSDAFIIDAYPIAIQAGDLAVVVLGALLCCLLASFYPARKAADLAIVDAIRELG